MILLYYFVFSFDWQFFTLIDNSSNLMVKYTYNAWGNVLSTTGSIAGTLGEDKGLAPPVQL